MALKIQVKELKVRDQSKWYGRVVKKEDVHLKEIAKAISEKSTFTEGDIYGVLKEMVKEMKFFMQMGHTVKIDELGSFHLTVEGGLVENREDYRIDQNVKSVKCKFRPSGHRIKNGKMLYDFCDGVVLERE